MPKQYAFKIWRAGKYCTYYNICHDEAAAVAWIETQANMWDWGEKDIDWDIQSITSRPLSQVYEHNGDKAGYLCEIMEEIFARECSNNCPNTEFRGLSYVDLCEAAIEILESLKGGDKNVAL